VNSGEDQFNGKEIESENVLNMVHEPRQIIKMMEI